MCTSIQGRFAYFLSSELPREHMVKYRLKMLRIFSLSILTILCLYSSARQRVILITIDGLRNDILTNASQPAPFLHEMMQKSIYVPNVIGVNPTMTYPAHTTLVTGSTPLEHGIHCNRQFQFNRAEPALHNWYADSIRTKTLWQIVKEQGGKTASVFWPVTTGSKWIDFNLPEYFPTTKVYVSGMDYIRPVCTPSGIMAELEREATGHLSDTTLRAGSFQYDAKVASIVNYLTNRYKPDFMTVHLVTTDYKQHETGINSFETQQSVAAADHAIGLILENLEYTHQKDSVTIIVTGDHGFTQGRYRLHPNALLVSNGLLSEQPGGDWQVCFNSLGAAAYMYVNPKLSSKQKARCIEKVRMILSEQPDSVRSLYNILSNKEIVDIKGDPTAALCLAPVSGVGCSNERKGEFITDFKGGLHGYVYLSATKAYDPTSLIVYGNIDRNLIKSFLSAPDTIQQTSIAPLILSIIGIENYKQQSK